MDQLFSQLALNSVTFVGKAAFGAATSLAIKHVSSLLQNASTRSTSDAEDLYMTKAKSIEQQFKHRLSILTQVVDLVEVGAARGHSILNSALPLVLELKRMVEEFSIGLQTLSENDELASLTQQLNQSSITESSPKHPDKKASTEGRAAFVKSLDLLYNSMRQLIDEIDNYIPYLQLILTVSGVNFEADLSKRISISRLLRASKYLSEISTDIKKSGKKNVSQSWIPVCKPLYITAYTLFFGSVRTKSSVQWTWKEEYPMAYLWLERSLEDTLSFHYRIRIERDLDDGLARDEVEVNEIEIELSDVRKLFYSNAGRLLRIEDSTMPCLILKIEEGFETKSLDRKNVKQGANSGQNTPIRSKYGASPKWFAFEYYDNDRKRNEERNSTSSESESNSSFANKQDYDVAKDENSVSELEYLIKLANLEAFKQCSHLNVPDELLSEFLRSDDVSRAQEEEIVSMPKSFKDRLSES